MRGTWSLTRCPAPTRTEGGTLRCVQTLAGCSTPTHRRWDRLAPLMAIVWWLRPWWPNAIGRAQDRRDAHTCPNVWPCTACVRERTQLAEEGRRLASERDDLITRGVDPADLLIPLYPQEDDR